MLESVITTLAFITSAIAAITMLSISLFTRRRPQFAAVLYFFGGLICIGFSVGYVLLLLNFDLNTAAWFRPLVIPLFTGISVAAYYDHIRYQQNDVYQDIADTNRSALVELRRLKELIEKGIT